MTGLARRLRGAGATAAAIALGLALGSLPFVYYRFGVGRHHVAHRAADVPAAASEGGSHASHRR